MNKKILVGELKKTVSSADLESKNFDNLCKTCGLKEGDLVYCTDTNNLLMVDTGDQKFVLVRKLSTVDIRVDSILFIYSTRMYNHTAYSAKIIYKDNNDITTINIDYNTAMDVVYKDGHTLERVMLGTLMVDDFGDLVSLSLLKKGKSEHIIVNAKEIDILSIYV